MPTREEIVANYLDAQKSQDESKVKAASEALADGAVLVSPRGNVEGRDAIVERLRNPGQAKMLLDRLTWGAPETASESALKVKAELPAGLPIPIQEFSTTFHFGAGDKIEKVEVVLQR